MPLPLLVPCHSGPIESALSGGLHGAAPAIAMAEPQLSGGRCLDLGGRMAVLKRSVQHGGRAAGVIHAVSAVGTFAWLAFGSPPAFAGTVAADDHRSIAASSATATAAHGGPRPRPEGGDNVRTAPQPPSTASSQAERFVISAATWRRLGDLYATRAQAAYEHARQVGAAAPPPVPTTALTQNVTVATLPAAAISGTTAMSGSSATAVSGRSAAAIAGSVAAGGVADGTAQHTVAMALEGWAAHWRARDTAAYLADYTADYTGRAPDHGAWAAARRERLAATSHIDVQLSDLSVQAHGPVAVARFTQRYTSDGYTDVSHKYVRLQRDERKGWLIARELVVD